MRSIRTVRRSIYRKEEYIIALTMKRVLVCVCIYSEKVRINKGIFNDISSMYVCGQRG